MGEPQCTCGAPPVRALGYPNPGPDYLPLHKYFRAASAQSGRHSKSRSSPPLAAGQCSALTRQPAPRSTTSYTSGNITDEFVFLGSKRIAHRYASGEITCYAEDMLGTNRVILPSAAGSPCYDADFYPFGGEREYTTSCAENYKFEGKKRDQETRPSAYQL
jgi:hypothetical protein